MWLKGLDKEILAVIACDCWFLCIVSEGSFQIIHPHSLYDFVILEC